MSVHIDKYYRVVDKNEDVYNFLNKGEAEKYVQDKLYPNPCAMKERYAISAFIDGTWVRFDVGTQLIITRSF